MAQYSMNAYDADIHIPKFKGLIANCNDPDGNLMYAVEAENVDTTDGFLQPAVDPETIYLQAHGHWDDPMYQPSTPQTQKSLDEYMFDLDPSHSDYWHWKLNNKTEQEIFALRLKYYSFYGGSPSFLSEYGGIPIIPTESDSESDSYQSNISFVGRVYSEVNSDYVYIYASHKGLFWFCENGWSSTMYPNCFAPLTVTGIVHTDGTITTKFDANNPFYEGWDMPDQDPQDENPSPLYSLGALHWSAVSYQAMAQDEYTAEAQQPSPIAGEPAYEVGTTCYYDDVALYLSCEAGLYVVQTGKSVFSGLVSYGNTDTIVKCYKIETPVVFDHIETFGERLWGCKGDRLFYSTPYKPYDWGQNNDHPSDGAGEIQEPNWDGDYFTGLRSFGNYLVAFKRHRAWKVSGVDIGTSYIIEQYGFGTPFPESVVSSGEYIYLATQNGLAYYDGSVVRPMLQDELRELWGTLDIGNLQGFLYENRKYCLAFPRSGVMIVYDIMDGSVLCYKDMNIVGFLHPILSQEPIALCNDGAKSNLKTFGFNAWEKDLNGARATKWVTPWIELGRKDVKKGGFELYFTPEVKGTNPVTFTISIETEKKKKTKTYTVAPNVSETLQGKTKRLHFGGGGRRFRLIIQTPSGTSLKWRLYGGIHIIAEIDKD